METVPEFGAPAADMHNNMSEDDTTTHLTDKATLPNDAYEQLTILPHDFFALSCE